MLLKSGKFALACLHKELVAKFGISAATNALYGYQQELGYATSTGALTKPMPTPYLKFHKEKMGKYARLMKGCEAPLTDSVFPLYTRTIGEEWHALHPVTREEYKSSNIQERWEWGEFLKKCFGPEDIRDELSERWLRKVKDELLMQLRNQELAKRNYNREHIKRVELIHKLQLHFGVQICTRRPLYYGFPVFCRGRKGPVYPNLLDKWTALDAQTCKEYECLADKEEDLSALGIDTEECVFELEEYISETVLNNILRKEALRLSGEMNRPLGTTQALYVYKLFIQGQWVGWLAEKWKAMSESEKAMCRQKQVTLKRLEAFEKWANSLQPGVLEILSLQDYRKLGRS